MRWADLECLEEYSMADSIDQMGPDIARGISQFNPIGQIMGGAQSGGQQLMQYLPILMQLLQGQNGAPAAPLGTFQAASPQQPPIGLRGRMTGAK